MPDATVFDQATAVIEKVRAQPIDALEALALQRPVRDPLLRSAMHIRQALVVSSKAVVVHQDRLHAMRASLLRPGTDHPVDGGSARRPG
ncbi:hypothetical protein [Streptomyces sp. CBMA29]|uniref:hypothetical protein n=1 Tax=Streptomyces sp. CBMA29 TaxID=1896314 RepID=UPI001CB734C6|nr:hypothetical protein [Streptomyces sp. CBMA29]